VPWGAFNLRKWNTNSSSIQKKLPETDIHTKTAPKHSSVNVVEDDQSYSESVTCKSIGVTNGSVRVLGTIWNKSSDELESGMPEVAEGKGCDLLSKGHIFKKRAETKMKGHLPAYNLI
jgi:hypothetical protein